MLSDSKISSLYFEALGSQHLREQDRTTVSRFALAVEAEVRAQDTALIQQLVEAVQIGFDQTCSVGRQKDWAQLSEALAAGRARLKEIAP